MVSLSFYGFCLLKHDPFPPSSPFKLLPTLKTSGRQQSPLFPMYDLTTVNLTPGKMQKHRSSNHRQNTYQFAQTSKLRRNPCLDKHTPHLLQPLRQRRRIPHPWEILRRIHTKRLRPRLRQDWHRLPRILHAAPVHESELKSVESRRAHGEIGEDEECRGDFGVFVRLWSCFSV